LFTILQAKQPLTPIVQELGGLQNKPGYNGREKYSVLGIKHQSSGLFALTVLIKLS
jgi:hypothetical protein